MNLTRSQPKNSPRLEAGRCPLCGVAPERLVRTSRSWHDEVEGEFEVRACPACGLWITSPRPVEEDLHLIYPADYIPYRATPADVAGDAPPATAGTLLDVGCGSGKYLEVARQQGYEATGIEWSPVAAEVARARGFEVIVGDALTVDFPDRRFDVVRSAHVLEHVGEPVRLLERLAQATEPDGRVEVIVPNAASLGSRLFRGHWHGLDLPRHLYHYRPADMRRLAEAAGLRVTREHHEGSSGPFLGSVDRLIAARGRTRRVRENARLRRAVYPLTFLFARARMGDVVRYHLQRVA